MMFLFWITLTSHLFVARGFGESSSTGECDSFYDYVCNLDATETGTMSYFELLREKHRGTLKNVVKNEPLFERCMKKITQEVPSSSSLARLSKTNPISIARKRSTVPASFYSTFWTAENIKRNGIGFEFPVKVQIVKRLDSPETCLDVSPNVKWLNSAYDVVETREASSLLENALKNDPSKREVVKLLIDFVKKLKDAFDSTNAHMESVTEEEAMIDYVDSYGTIGEYDSSSSSNVLSTTAAANSNVRFWKDVFMNLYDLKDASFCLHTNGYEKYYGIVEKYVSFKTSEFDFSDALEAFSDDLKFGIYRNEKPFEKVTRCEKMVRKAIPRRINDAFLKASGASVAFENDFSVERMVEELKIAINETVYESAHLPRDFKTFASEKLSHLKTFVVNKRSKLSKEDAEESENACFSSSSSSSSLDDWNALTECLAERRLSIERDIVKKSLFYEGKDYDKTMNHDERHEYIYENTDLSIVNAWYDPTKNEITIPAGIVFWPMYSGTAFDINDMYDYSRMGMILAHELGHALDSNGLCWDERGNYDVTKRYCATSRLPPLIRENMECLATDYGHPCGGADEYGERTLGEDMADQLGVIASWKVFSRKYEHTLRIEDKREFFRKYAQLWCEGKHPKAEQSRSFAHATHLDDVNEKRNEYEDGIGKKSNLPFALERLKIAKRFKTRVSTKNEGFNNATSITNEAWMCERVMSDVHALPKHRVNKTLRQLKAFSDTFGCKKGNEMINRNPCVVY